MLNSYTGVPLISIYVSNGLAIGLLLMLLFTNTEQMSADKNQKEIKKWIIVVLLSCIADIISYTVDGRPGHVHTILVYLCDTALFVSNMYAGWFWVNFLADHIGTPVTSVRRAVHTGLFAFGLIVLAVNLFCPVVFSVENGIYRREALYWLYVAIAVCYMADSVVIYISAKRKGGILTFFPIQVFLVPALVGLSVQTAFYEISVICAAEAIAITGIITALKNEIIYTDRLTGLYNRYYLEYLQKRILKNKEAYITGVMADLNNFKSINDTYGHAAGDKALIAASEIFVRAADGYGSVIRYAGDEFVILLNTVDEKKVRIIMEKISSLFAEFNQSGEKPYKLSASMGYSVLDVKNQNISEFMNAIDAKMYENKRAYYMAKENDRRK